MLGMGLNVAALPGDVPPGAGGLPATSLEQQGATTTDRTDIAVELLKNLAELDDAWRQERGDPIASGLHAEYRRHCSTLGLRVRIELRETGSWSEPGSRSTSRGSSWSGPTTAPDTASTQVTWCTSGRPPADHRYRGRSPASGGIAVAYPDDLLGEDEHVVIHKHPHWKMLFWPIVVFLITVAVGAYLAALVSSQSWHTYAWIAMGSSRPS
ncbi:hypothetical protein GCM10018954_040450 [Kutzneria kofuensis]